LLSHHVTLTGGPIYTASHTCYEAISDVASLISNSAHHSYRCYWWLFGLVITRWSCLDQQSCAMPGLMSTRMDNCLKSSKPSRCRTNHPGLLSLAIPLGAMSTSENWAANKHTTCCISPCLWTHSVSCCRRSAPQYGKQ